MTSPPDAVLRLQPTPRLGRDGSSGLVSLPRPDFQTFGAFQRPVSSREFALDLAATLLHG
jgi:hypothetical protein